MRLYKYFHPDRVDVLRSGMIRFTPPNAFNDPFDLKPNIQGFASRDYWDTQFKATLTKIVEEQYAELPAEIRSRLPLATVQQLAEAKRPQMETESFQLAEFMTPYLRSIMEAKFEELLGILCLTEKQDNLLMWAHYTDSHQGFVLEFDGTAPFFDQRVNPEDELRHLRKVKYSPHRPTLSVSEIEHFDVFLTKSQDWEYEQEWRMLSPLASASEVIDSKPTNIHLFAFPKGVVTSVIFGCRMNDNVKAGILEVLRADSDYLMVRVFQAHVDERHYKLNIVETAANPVSQ